MPPYDPDNPLAAEILQETASSYFAACRKMVDSLEALNAFDRSIGSGCQDDEQNARRSELLDEAAERVFFVGVQREAMALSYYETFFEDYGIPEEVRAVWDQSVPQKHPVISKKSLARLRSGVVTQG
jgi:hypothetical protein